ncbi:hypothetical protein BDP27DRAFT_353587 [Rhodocollybia butyracea]|uniref:Uncharacterized protein n=1 Tax=Rhodocollybia butyracea TaxID=206335 RepID=A0A9P5Q2S1_9AGAR|nr:hypothetical protein BDP27DRAFT_353587 [Rhodocollybia butyracea]
MEDPWLRYLLVELLLTTSFIHRSLCRQRPLYLFVGSLRNLMCNPECFRYHSTAIPVSEQCRSRGGRRQGYIGAATVEGCHPQVIVNNAASCRRSSCLEDTAKIYLSVVRVERQNYWIMQQYNKYSVGDITSSSQYRSRNERMSKSCPRFLPKS